MTPRLRSIVRGAGYALLLPIAIVLMAVGAIYMPPIQRWSKGYLENQLSDMLGMQLSVSEFTLGFPARLSMTDFRLIKPNGDTLVSIDHLRGDVALLPLLRGGLISIGELETKGFILSITDSLETSLTYVNAYDLSARGVYLDLAKEDVRLDYLLADRGAIIYESRDTTASDGSDPSKWRINIGHATLTETSLLLDMPMDSLYFDLGVSSLDLEEALVELEHPKFEAARARLKASNLRYALVEGGRRSGYFDPNDVQLTSLSLDVSDIYSHGSDLRLAINECTAEEQSGLNVEMLKGKFSLNTARIRLNDIEVKTNRSYVYLDTSFPRDSILLTSVDPTSLSVKAEVYLEDLRYFAQTKDLYSRYRSALSLHPNLASPIRFNAELSGVPSQLDLDSVSLSYADQLHASLRGRIALTAWDELPKGKLQIRAGLNESATALFPLLGEDESSSWSIIRPVALTADLRSTSSDGYWAKCLIDDGEGSLSFMGVYNERQKKYQGDLVIDRLRVSDYLVGIPIDQISATGRLDGRGYDLFDLSSRAQLNLHVSEMNVSNSLLCDVSLDGTLNDGQLFVALNSDNDGLNISGVMDGLLADNTLTSSISLDASRLDLPSIGLANWPLSGSFEISGELRSDMNKQHRLSLALQGIDLAWGGERYQTKIPIHLAAQTGQANTELTLRSGDLDLSTSSPLSYDSLMGRWARIDKLLHRLEGEIYATDSMELRMKDLLAVLPSLDLSLTMGRQNFLTSYLTDRRLALGQLNLNLSNSSTNGLSAHLEGLDLRQDAIRYDSLVLDLTTLFEEENSNSEGVTEVSTPSQIRLDGLLAKKAYLKQRALRANVSLLATLQDLALKMRMESSGSVLVDLDSHLAWNGAAYTAHFPRNSFVVADNELSFNPDHYIRLSKEHNLLDADLVIQQQAGQALLNLKAHASETLAQQGHLSINGLDIERFASLGLPDMGGVMTADLAYTRMGGWEVMPTVTGDISVQALRFEDKKLGHLASALFYEPRNDNSHYLLGEVSYEGMPALSLDAIYYSRKDAQRLEGTLGLTDFPLDIANPFLAAYNMTLTGRASGQTRLSGEIKALRLDGGLNMPNARLGLRDLGVELLTDTIPIRLEDEKIYFDHYALHSGVDSQHPIYIDGAIDLSSKRWLETTLAVKTDELLLMNTERSRLGNELLYGRLLASANLSVRGKLDALRVRGNTSILGGTNCVYVMKEGTLDATDRMNAMVSFVDFADTLFVQRNTYQEGLGGLDVSLRIDVDPAVRFGVDLTEDGRDYMRVEGGGTLQFAYTPDGEMRLNGRYDMTGGGQMRYTLPVVGAKSFAIEPTGYLRFSGDIANPYINFKASQEVRATVGSGSEAQKTNFEVSIQAKNTLENIDLKFDLSAPENLSVSNELSGMTQEERGKQALGLLASGVYLGTGSMSGALTLENTLSSLIQSQINSATGSLLRGTDLSIGMESGEASAGLGEYTNYTYNFSRRFYNDRIRITVGGKVQSGGMATNKEKSLIDNVSIEYQLDKAGNHSAKLYHKNVTNDALEGEHTETGATYTIRRRLHRLKDLFRFKLRRRAPQK